MLTKIIVSRKAQVTIFVVVGILIVLGIGVAIYFNSVNNPDRNLPPESASFKTFMDSCLKEELNDAIIAIGYQGGYSRINVENNDPLNTDFFDVNIPYYFYENKNTMLSEERLKEELKSYIENDFVTYCLDYKYYETDFSFKLNAEKSEVNVRELSFAKDKVSVSLDYPITIIGKENTTITIRDFKAEVPVRLERIFNQAEKIIKIQEEDKYHICLTCIEKIREKDIEIEFFDWVDNSAVFVLTDKKSVINQNPYRFFFAMKYTDWSCDNLPEDIDEYIKLQCEFEKSSKEERSLENLENADNSSLGEDEYFDPYFNGEYYD